MSATWTWMLCSSQGVAIAELSTAAGKSITYRRNTFTEASCTFSHEDPQASLLFGALANDGVPTLRCYRKPDQTSPGVLRFAGYLSAIHEEAEETSLLTTVWRSPFGRLYGNGNDRGRFITTRIAPFVATDAGQIAKSLLDATNLDSATRMVAGTIDATKNRDRTYPVGTNVGDAIQNLTSVLDGFDFYEQFVDAGLSVTVPTLSNPSFDVDTSGWTVTGPGATFTRDSAVFDTAPASGRLDWTAGIGNPTLTTSFSGTFLRGVAYKLEANISVGPNGSVTFTLGYPGDMSSVYLNNGTAPFDPFYITWIPKSDIAGSNVQFSLLTNSATPGIYIDSLRIRTGIVDSTLNIVASQGVDNPNARFEYGPGTLSNVQKLSRDWEGPANSVFVIGGNGLTSTYTDATSVAKYGKWVEKAEYSDVTDQNTLDDKAKALVRPYPVRTLSFTPDPALAPKAFDDYGLADTVRLFARRGALVEDTLLRINAFTLLVNEEGDEAEEIADPTMPGADAVLRASLTAEVLSPPVTPA